MKIKLNGVPATPEQIAALVAELGLGGVQALAQQAQSTADAAGAAAADALEAATRRLNASDIADFGIAAKASLAPELVEARDRSEHTGTQPARTIIDFDQASRSVLLASVVPGPGISLTVVNGQLVISATGGGQAADEGIYIDRDYIEADYIE